MNRKMRVLGIAVTALLAFGVIAASSAQAYTWTINGTETMEANVTPAASTHFILKSTLLGEELELEATGLECKSGTTCKISSVTNGGGGKNEAKDSGGLTFTGVTVKKPAGCTVLNGKVETELLNTKLVTEAGLASGLADEFTPASGTKFATVKIRECAAAENYPVTGSIAAETEAVGVEIITQPLHFSGAISTATGKQLLFGGEKATLEGTGSNTLPGSPGVIWGSNAQ